MAELKLYKATSKGLKIIGISLPFVVMGVWMILESETGTTNYIMGWIGTCFFGLGIPIGLIQSFDRRAQIIINENGIWDRTTKQDGIKWEQIIDAYPLDIFKQKFISIVSDDSFVFKKKPYKWAAKLNKAIGAQNLNLNLGQINIEVDKLNEFILELKNAEKKDRKKIIENYNYKVRKNEISLSTFLKISIYISISIALLLLSLTSIIALWTIMIIMGIATFAAQGFWGFYDNSKIRKYAGIIAWLGFVNMFLCLVTLKTYDHISKRVGQKISIQIDDFKQQNSSYPNDLTSIFEKTDLNLIEKIFANRLEYRFTEDDYELMTINLLHKEKLFDRNTEEWE